MRCSARWTNLFFVAEALPELVPYDRDSVIRAMFEFGCGWQVRAAHETKQRSAHSAMEQPENRMTMSECAPENTPQSHHARRT